MTGTLEDREAIRDVIAAYAHAIDRRRWDMMAALFHADAVFGFGPVQGDWQGFVEQARAIIDPCLITQHQLGQVSFGFESAHICYTETYMTAMHTIPAGYPMTEVFPDKGTVYSAVIAGRYVDRFEKRDGVWRIAHRTGIYDWREYREVEGVDLSAMPEGACGFHDDRDPSTPVVRRWRPA
ncbi:nuclear transport factor 2 family protein [Altererythrobacter sp. H2]|uniref:nuclear transport factor 2 family protein n=1 Tax=Altererythrobacter sp. H2 TaxID=3108391 RepID=UPI002B4BB866|nr:nuclear transport factor 2 family protein [Altererythrobacter sp. H2]WRK96242.1 nuclear transport factor 2 family protein [Altererythrobacter sp. H2]